MPIIIKRYKIPIFYLQYVIIQKESKLKKVEKLHEISDNNNNVHKTRRD